jgi:hypothetical protein
MTNTGSSRSRTSCSNTSHTDKCDEALPENENGEWGAKRKTSTRFERGIAADLPA